MLQRILLSALRGVALATLVWRVAVNAVRWTFEDKTETARRAFHTLEAHPFDTAVERQVDRDLKRLKLTANSNVWVLIARSRLRMEQGYKVGDRLKASSYRDGAIDEAEEFALRAVQADPSEPMALVQRARIEIIRGQLKVAWQTINAAYKLDPTSAYPFFLRAAIAEQMKDANRAEKEVAEAAARIALPYQRTWVEAHGIAIAKLRGDVAAQEAHYRALIALDPTRPHAHGNFASFLKHHGRLDEAIEQYQEALRLGVYPLAQRGLEDARAQQAAAAASR